MKISEITVVWKMDCGVELNVGDEVKVVTNSCERVIGTIEVLNQERITICSEQLGEVSIEKEDIHGIEYIGQ